VEEADSDFSDAEKDAETELAEEETDAEAEMNSDADAEADTEADADAEAEAETCSDTDAEAEITEEVSMPDVAEGAVEDVLSSFSLALETPTAEDEDEVDRQLP
jgi:membrane protein involved in colicin uptake